MLESTMRLIILVFLLINPFISAFSQAIKGTVFDKKTNKIICYATVYINGSFVGTTTDQNGNFELNVSKKYRLMPVTISCIGYYSVTLSDFSKTEPLKVYLQPKLYELDDVVISSKTLKRKRKKYLNLFRDEFIGTTANASGCKILNEQDITFNYDSDNEKIKAYALAPILIENKALGYKITYYLDKFEYYKRVQATFFSGNIIFNEDLTEDSTQAKSYNRRREYTYFGSRKHFFRVLWSGDLKPSGFTVRDLSHKTLKFDAIVYKDEWQNRFLSYSSSILIEYNERKSTIDFIKKPVYFDESGFFNQGIKWTGDMAVQRIADWLPYEYEIELE